MATSQPPENRLAGEKGFKNKTLFLTGGTGFLGKVLIEKILRTTPLVGKIYVLIRIKKGKGPQTRLDEMFSDPLFDLVRETQGEEIFNKVIAVQGDASEINLGLTAPDRKLLIENVQLIYNIAASTRFDDPFKKAIIFNTRSTREALNFAKECKKLLAFVHVSTAYCFPQERVLYEKVYPTKLNPHDVIKVVETMDEEVVDAMGEKLMKGYPNTYTVSKALAETLVSDEMDNLPVMIVRPSLVIPIWQDPIPGWANNIFGPMGLLVAAGKGVLRCMYCKSKGYADFLPADVVAGGLMFAAYDYMTNKSRRIFNLTSSSEIKVTWGEIIQIGRKIITTKMPFNWVVWYPGGALKPIKFDHRISVVLYHYIPALFIDSLIMLTGNKPILWKIQQKLTGASYLFEYYANNQWDFNNSNALEVRNSLNETEKAIYKADPKDLDLESYFYDCIHSTRVYILKEGDETLPTARRHMKIMWTLDVVFKILLLVGIAYLIYWVYTLVF